VEFENHFHGRIPDKAVISVSILLMNRKGLIAQLRRRQPQVLSTAFLLTDRTLENQLTELESPLKPPMQPYDFFYQVLLPTYPIMSEHTHA